MGYKDLEKTGVCEVIEGKIYFAVLQRPEDLKGSWLPRPALCFSTDNEFVYEPFFQDFGPLNIACTYRFCWKLHGLLQDAATQGRCVCYCCSVDPKKKSNAGVLLGAYLVLFASWDADTAYAPIAHFEPYFPFRDPTTGISTYQLTVLDCIRAVAKGKKVGWINFNDFNVEEYEYFEQVENGDLNWMVPNKLLAFSGPSSRRTQVYGYRTLVPEDYVEYFKRVGVVAVIRLNKRIYDRHRFTSHGINHHDLYFPDGSCPPERIVHHFLELVEDTPAAVAVHCKAGLGRTGVLIGCYIMKHFHFTANETLGYLRLMRPGSVIGPQQHFLRDMQNRMWKAGDLYQRRKSNQVTLSVHERSSKLASDCTLSVWRGSSIAATPWIQGGLLNSNPLVPLNQEKDRSIESGKVSELETLDQMHKQASTSAGSQLEQTELRREENICYVYKPRGSRINSSPQRVARVKSSKRQTIEDAMGALNLGSITSNKAFIVQSVSSQNALNRTGILRNACKSDMKDAVYTQRTINSAGQPRKLMIPLSQSARTAPNDLSRRRSNSPPRTRSKSRDAALGS